MLDLYVPVLIHPARGFRAIAQAGLGRRPRAGLVAIVALGLAYSLTCLGLYLGPAEPLAAPVLPIAAAEYYLWLAVLTLPTLVAIWVVYTVTAQLVARTLGGRAGLASLLDATGAALALPVFVTMWLPETGMAVALVIGAVDWPTMSGWQGVAAWDLFNLVRQYGGGLSMVTLVAIAIREVHRVGSAAAIVASLAGLIPAAAVSYLVIR